MAKKKRLSLCLLTFQAEPYLVNCVQECREFADEVILIDLSSHDSTAQRARQVGAAVYKLPWNHDFSAVKNFCMEHATGQWILFLNTDETIPAEYRANIRPLLDNPNVEGYMLYRNDPTDTRGVSSPMQSLRLVRNRKEYRFQYRSFEKIPEEQMANIEDADLQISHREEAGSSWLISMRILLLQEEIAAYPDDPYLQYLYGIELLNQQKMEACAEYLKKAYEGTHSDVLYAPHLAKCYIWVLLYLQQHEEMRPILNEAIERYPFYTDFLVLRGELYRQMQQYDKAIADLQTCLRIRERPHYLVPGPEIGEPVVLETLGELYEEMFELEQAVRCYQQAYEKTEDPILLTKIRFLSGELEETDEKAMDSCIEAQDVGQLLRLVRPWAEQNDMARIKNLYERIKPRELQEEFLQKMMGYLLYYDHPESVSALQALGTVSISEEMECVLQAKRDRKSLTLWMEQRKGSIVHTLEPKVLQTWKKQTNFALNRFYQTLVNERDTAGSEENTCAQLHVKIGDFYARQGKEKAAFCACCKALQWDPLYEPAQHNLQRIFERNIEEMTRLLEDAPWIPETILFSKHDFKYYVLGIVAFQNQQFEQAVSYFSQMGETETSCCLKKVYWAAGLWLGQKEVQWENGEGMAEEIGLLCEIITRQMIHRLQKQTAKFSSSGLIRKEIERISQLRDVSLQP